MTLDTMKSVVDELKRRGISASLEYPGFLQVGPVAYGDANDFFSGDVMEDGEVVEVLESSIPSDSTDVERIADYIACNVPASEGN